MSSVRNHLGTLFFDFRYRGVRCREYTKLPDIPANRKRMHKVLDQIEQAIVTGTFHYADFWSSQDFVDTFGEGSEIAGGDEWQSVLESTSFGGSTSSSNRTRKSIASR